ncbi:glycosyltransferase family 2 protein [Egicoccus halophilus]|uniref:Glycosyltransferase 2-like domain-containing protein n=1 Tax=Egicoccus halophilus TaxID=1670830 RepID=A0A8J3AE74_9ACTN|nr:glycosyltransferase [Egicoccus halophilus]GGI05406.1 hypothetical protein GCM10011354_13940 [Egicoccus halophilus]
MTTVSVLMTCHERRERTLACLRSLRTQQGLDGVGVEVVLVDAGSRDGTADAVEAAHPEVTVLRRGDELFWNGGMRVALAEAHRSDPDHYLWLNDDVDLDADALRTLLDTFATLEPSDGPCIVVGSTRDPATGELTYGGVVRPHRFRPTSYDLIEPGPAPRRAETMNGNVVLVPRAVVGQIGNLAAAYTHGFGDYDYGHRAELAGFAVWVAPGTIGTCSRNPAATRERSFAEHRRRAVSVRGGLPPREWTTFTRRWAGPVWPVFAVSPYVKRWVHWLRSA